jgi:hypothetical protein
MRLLNTATLSLHEFISDKVPPYAILSHTWGEEEVSFQEMQSREATGLDIHKAGYEKIKKCCETGAADGYEYVWIDACCIDKTSSAELSEAINSMFRWYKLAEVCYVILSDCPSSDDPTKEDSAFARSRWFTRGWTLQELIAPTNLIFFNQDWEDIGTRWSLREELITITGIDSGVFVGTSLGAYSTAQRMSWASRRETKRTEDIAYCLMGIFGINMPMLYGEGAKAFMRLQEEILRTTDDQTIFAWRSNPTPGYENSLLASHPSAFAASSFIKRRRGPHSRHTPITLSNGLIQVQLPVVAFTNGGPDCFLVVLNCREDISTPPEEHQVCIVMKEFAGSQMDRINTNTLEMINTAAVSSLKLATIFNKVTFFDRRQHTPRARFSCRLDDGDLFQQGITLVDFTPGAIRRKEDNRLFHLQSDRSKFCAMRFQDRSRNTFDLKMSINPQHAFHTIDAAIGQNNSSDPIPRTPKSGTYWSHPGWSSNSDRLLWHWKGGNMWIQVTIKKCVEDEITRHVVHLSSRELD